MYFVFHELQLIDSYLCPKKHFFILYYYISVIKCSPVVRPTQDEGELYDSEIPVLMYLHAHTEKSLPFILSCCLWNLYLNVQSLKARAVLTVYQQKPYRRSNKNESE